MHLWVLHIGFRRFDDYYFYRWWKNAQTSNFRTVFPFDSYFSSSVSSTMPRYLLLLHLIDFQFQTEHRNLFAIRYISIFKEIGFVCAFCSYDEIKMRFELGWLPDFSQIWCHFSFQLKCVLDYWLFSIFPHKNWSSIHSTYSLHSLTAFEISIYLAFVWRINSVVMTLFYGI